MIRAIWDEPVTTTFPNGMTLFTTPPPTSGPILAAILGVMSQFNLTKSDFEDVVSYQRFVEACKYGFAERTKLGDWQDPFIKEDMKEVINIIMAFYYN